MPQRRLPNSNAKRVKALKAATDRKNAVPAPVVIPFSAATIARLNVFYPAYQLKIEAMEAALVAQATVTGSVIDSRFNAEVFISSFFSTLQYAVRRKTFNPAVRAYYGLAVSDDNLPRIKSEADIIFWGEKAATGEAARLAAGGAPIMFPSIAEVTAAVNNFANPNMAQANAKSAYDAAQESVEADSVEADKLILKMWNEIETAFDEGDKPSMRRKAREWGVVYVPNPGEAPKYDEYSIMGKVTDAANGSGIKDAALLITETNTTLLTDEQGNYLVPLLPAGNYTLAFYKGGYQTQNIVAAVVTASAITTVNVVLQAGSLTGMVQGQVKQMGMGISATITIAGVPGSFTTDALGQYILSDVAEGTQTIKATLNNGSGNTQTQPVNVLANTTVTLDFNF